ncbi:MAG: hypothetical protein ACRBFS_01240 [Aureispira sp.]
MTFSFVACKGSKDGLDKVSASNGKNKRTGKNAMLLYSNDVLTKEAYADIKGNIPRLKAMMAGRFVQHNTNGDPARKVYSVWKVNGKKDSVVIYQLPVGDPNKDGHWVYHYQFMTSLPNDPVYAAFSKMTEINRDSIVAFYYEVPDDFTATIPEILAKPENVFRDFDFDDLKISETNEVVYYERKTPLQYYGVSRWMNSTSDDPEREGGYEADYYRISPDRFTFGKAIYNKEKKFLGNTAGERLVKEARVQPEYIGR